MQTVEQKMETRQMRELRKQNSKLKRENAHLRKQLLRFENSMYEAEGVDEDAAYVDGVTAGLFSKKDNEAEKLTCPGCGVYNVHSFVLLSKRMINCLGCGHRGWAVSNQDK